MEICRSHSLTFLPVATAGVEVTQVHYRGAGPALIDMLGGQTQAIFATLPSSIQYISSP
jgi:tripartite-type tricarboxylate transporter receptor subunit TctC